MPKKREKDKVAQERASAGEKRVQPLAKSSKETALIKEYAMQCADHSTRSSGFKNLTLFSIAD